ncbi:MAG: hypothetical protein V1870_03095 [Candidatus Aenigmatarchaeota archaeon]
MSWVFLILAAAFAYALGNVVEKIVIDKHLRSPMALVTIENFD